MSKQQIADNIIARAKTTLYFLEHVLKDAGVRANDVAWQRSILLMLSYAFELVLKTKVVLSSVYTKVDDIDRELKCLGHDIQDILHELESRKLLSSMKITSYDVSDNLSFKQYKIVFEDGGSLVVEDFVDIRYDYTKKALRNIVSHDVIVGYLDKMIELSRNVFKQN